MRILVWLVRALAFFALFAFALNNLHEVTLHGFFGSEWRGPMVLVVLGALALGIAGGALAMLPSWWRHRRRALRDAAPSSILAPQDVEPIMAQGALTHPPRDGL
ncbi:MAG: LapA family protein [Burkholderiaceae bacterium]